MNDTESVEEISATTASFFERPQVQIEEIPVGQGVPLGIEKVSHPELGIGGAYGTWGECYDNAALPEFLERQLGEEFTENQVMNLSELGFISRHHTKNLSESEYVTLETEAGVRLLREAAHSNGWDLDEVDAVLIGMTGPATTDYVEQIARQAGIRDNALKMSFHKACDGSIGALNLALNPNFAAVGRYARSLADELYGKKVLVGGIEGLSRLLKQTRDKNAQQLFGNGAGIIGVIPGKTMKFLVGKAHEVFDEEGLLQVRMIYPHSRHKLEGESMIEVYQEGENHIRVSGLMHEPEDGSTVVMAGPMGMVKLFVRSGVQVVRDVYQAYQGLLEKVGMPEKSIKVAIVHHANFKINKLKEKNLQKEGIHLAMPWVISDFGNVSAASNMIAFLRELSKLKPGDHVLFDGFGAGTYYDVLAVEMGSSA